MVQPARSSDQHAVLRRPELLVAVPAVERVALDHRREPGGLDDGGQAQELPRPVDEDGAEISAAETALAARRGGEAAIGLAAAGDVAEQAVDVGPLVHHVHRPHDPVAAREIRKAHRPWTRRRRALAGPDGLDDGVAMLERHAHAEDRRRGPAGGERHGRPAAEAAFGVPHPLDLVEPSRRVGRVDADRLESGGRHPDLLEAAGILAEEGDGLADHLGVIDLQLGRGHQPEGRGDDVGLAARRGGEPAARDPARLDVIDAGQDIGHRAADVLEDLQSRMGRSQAGRLANLRGESAVLVLVPGGVGRGLRHLGRRLRPGCRHHPGGCQRGQDEGDPRAWFHGCSSPGSPIVHNPSGRTRPQSARTTARRQPPDTRKRTWCTIHNRGGPVGIGDIRLIRRPRNRSLPIRVPLDTARPPSDPIPTDQTRPATLSGAEARPDPARGIRIRPTAFIAPAARSRRGRTDRTVDHRSGPRSDPRDRLAIAHTDVDDGGSGWNGWSPARIIHHPYRLLPRDRKGVDGQRSVRTWPSTGRRSDSILSLSRAGQSPRIQVTASATIHLPCGSHSPRSCSASRESEPHATIRAFHVLVPGDLSCCHPPPRIGARRGRPRRRVHGHHLSGARDRSAVVRYPSPRGEAVCLPPSIPFRASRSPSTPSSIRRGRGGPSFLRGRHRREQAHRAMLQGSPFWTWIPWGGDVWLGFAVIGAFCLCDEPYPALVRIGKTPVRSDGALVRGDPESWDRHRVADRHHSDTRHISRSLAGHRRHRDPPPLSTDGLLGLRRARGHQRAEALSERCGSDPGPSVVRTRGESPLWRGHKWPSHAVGLTRPSGRWTRPRPATDRHATPGRPVPRGSVSCRREGLGRRCRPRCGHAGRPGVRTRQKHRPVLAMAMLGAASTGNSLRRG